MHVPPELYSLLGLSRVIGKGSYGMIYSLKYDKLHVIKITQDHPIKQNNSDFFDNKCDNILYHKSAIYFQQYQLWAVTYARATADLRKYITLNFNNNLKFVISTACKLINGIRHIHSIGFAHFDVSGANILVFDNGSICPNIKLSDFDFLSKVEIGNSLNYDIFYNGLVTIQYRPPEILFGSRNQICGSFTDIWSFCIVLIELILNKHPFLRYLYDFHKTPIRNEYNCIAKQVTLENCGCRKCHVKNHIEKMISKFDASNNTFVETNNCKLITHVYRRLHLLCELSMLSPDNCKQVCDTINELIKNIIFSEPKKRPTAQCIYMTLEHLANIIFQ